MTELFVDETCRTEAPERHPRGARPPGPPARPGGEGANQQALADAFPELAFIITGNAEVNTHMNAINDRLGFRVVERCLEVEKAL